MILFGDYHTHTPYSHGKGTILENAIVAKNKGLKEFAVTDHGFGHLLYGVNRKNISAMRKEIEEAKEKTGIKILLGIEANLISENGDVDLTIEEIEQLDIIVCGFHNFAKAPNFKQQFCFVFRNLMSIFWKPSKKRIEKNTNAYLTALERYPIDIISHLNYGCKTDTLQVAKKAMECGTYIELNGKRICFTEKEIIEMVKIGVKFIVDSDAHTADKVGECNHATNLITKYNIPLSQIVNFDKIPEFKKERK